MALINIFSTRAAQLKISSLDVDLSENESHEREVVVTTNPVEEGVDVSDHMQIRPARLTVTGLVTATPVRFLGGLFASPQRVTDYWGELKEILAARQLIDIQTGLDLYENMAMTSLKAPRDANTGEALRFTATFQEVVTAASQTVSVAPSPKPDAAAATSDSASLGQQATTETTSDDTILADWTGLRG